MSENHSANSRITASKLWSTAEDSIEPGNRHLECAVRKKSNRKLKASIEGKRSPWFGLGMFGLVGWSIALPIVGGILIGSWLDSRWPSEISWKLMLLFLGAIVGFSTACYWMRKEFES